MKKLSVLALSAALFMVSCKGDKTDNVATATEQTVAEQTGKAFTVNTESSSILWKAYHKGGLNPRFGSTKITGSLFVEQGSLTSGELISDINTLTTDPKAVDPAMSDGNTSVDLDAHLKSADFFDVEKYPNVNFAITKVEDLKAGVDTSKVEGANKMVSGNLTIKGKTVNVTFPAKVDITDAQVSLVSKITINRQDWGLTYGAEGNPKDWAISPDVDLEINILANK